MTLADEIIDGIRELLVRKRKEKLLIIEGPRNTVSIAITMHHGMYAELEQVAHEDNESKICEWIHCVLFREAVKHWLDRHPADTMKNQERMLEEIRPWLVGG